MRDLIGRLARPRLLAGLAIAGALLWGVFSLTGGAEGPRRETPFPEVAATRALAPAQPGQRYWAYGVGGPTMIDGRAYLYDLDARRLGQLSTGFWHSNLLPADRRGEILSVETYFSRGARGRRSDVVVAYDETTLSPKYEIALPPKRMNATTPTQMARLTADQRFMAVVNYTPAQSISILDLEKRVFIAEVETPGCMGAHEAGARSFYLICSNGSFMQLRLDETGAVVARRRTEPLFDAVGDPLTASPSRRGEIWHFISRQARLHPIRMTDAAIEPAESWPLITEAQRSDGWTIAGIEHSAIHQASGRLFLLVRNGEPDGFEDPGQEVWVYDLARRERIDRIAMEDLTLSIDVTQTDAPRLLTMDLHIPVSGLETMLIYLSEGEAGFEHLLQSRVNVYDADSGDHLARGPVNPGGLYTSVQAW